MPKATVILSAVPFAYVYIDGEYICSIPIQKTHDVEEGKHVIEFVSKDKTKRYPVEFEIMGGKTTKVFINMETGKYTITEQQII
jgi:hypothetical protein